jgi:hypothetical protein
MRQVLRWLRVPRHVRWPALVGMALPWLAVSVQRARRRFRKKLTENLRTHLLHVICDL